jgi:type VI protein secretion system component VasF
VQRATQPTLRHPDRSRLPWFRALLLEAQRSDLAMAIFKRGQNRSKRVSSRKEIIQLLWIILVAIVVVILGLYGGLASSHHH